MSTLSPRGKSTAVPQSSIRTYLHKTFNIHGNRFAQVPLNHSIPLDYIPNAHRFFFSQVFHFRRGIYLGFFANFCGPAVPDAINVSQTYPNFLIQRQVHSCNSSQFLPPSIPGVVCAWDWYNAPGSPFYGAQSYTWSKTF
jgi:hypothetical protein